VDDPRLRDRLRLGEDSQTGFKGVARNGYDVDVEDLARAIAAFANSGGGRIYLGVEDDGTATGVGTLPQADALMRQASQACRDRIRPAIACPVRKAAIDGAQVQKGARADLVRIVQSTDDRYDEQPVTGAGLQDLDLQVVEHVLLDACGHGR
jgi:ATP-dependent DNA helicase RecG